MKLESTIWPDGECIVARIEVLDCDEYIFNYIFDKDGKCEILVDLYNRSEYYDSANCSFHGLDGAKRWVADMIAEVERQHNEWLSLRQIHTMEDWQCMYG